MTKIAHLTSVHPANDTRVFHKMCRTLASAGYDVTLIVPHDRDEVTGGIRIRAIPKPKSRPERLARTVGDVYRAAVAEDADLYHFHDPELIPVGLLLRRRGRPVVYDVHEDYVTSIRQKPYLPPLARRVLAAVWGRPELLLSRPFAIVLAERYYAERFPRGTTVLNYPLKEYFADMPRERRGTDLVYTGVVAEDRGALIYADLAHCLDDVEVHVVGRCSRDLAQRMVQRAASGRERLHIEPVGIHVPYEQIINAYAQDRWVAGLALFPPTPNYMKTEPTKFFEYMAAEIPIICSDFPAWRSLVEGNGVGICVDPLDQSAVMAAVRHLISHPDEARQMGRNGRRAFESRYNWDTQASKLLDLYRQLLN
jgi:glycosyltransferase involved in cell wall biosynthesis